MSQSATAAAPARVMAAAAARRVISERSPSGSRISTVQQVVALALDRDVRESILASAASRGRRTQRPAREAAREIDAEHPVRARPVAGKRGADALDERHDLRVGCRFE